MVRAAPLQFLKSLPSLAHGFISSLSEIVDLMAQGVCFGWWKELVEKSIRHFSPSVHVLGSLAPYPTLSLICKRKSKGHYFEIIRKNSLYLNGAADLFEISQVLCGIFVRQSMEQVTLHHANPCRRNLVFLSIDSRCRVPKVDFLSPRCRKVSQRAVGICCFMIFSFYISCSQTLKFVGHPIPFSLKGLKPRILISGRHV